MNLAHSTASAAPHASSRIQQILQLTQLLPLYLLALLLASPLAQADSFSDGLDAYHAAQYAEAASAFERSLAESESAAARHNLALSLFQQGKAADAVWQLERAVRLAPTNRNYLYKLGALRQQLGLYKVPTTWWQSAANLLSQQTWIWSLCLSFWGLLASLLLPRIGGFRRPILLKLTSSFAAIALLISCAALTVRSTQQASGIVLSDSPIELRHAPASAAPEAGTARPGERARILDQHNQFLKIQTEAQITGWIDQATFRKL
ncbi:hypothetical protein QEH52_03390 [Coraliomargarita sp. SDUM461003]|uniref:SH3b domain-containing protein n=1 Tax=Thalassobacterium maritimum TaxID=3041265 RepID=A0ABU1ASF2_9BACT|nr:hypothetical protein [Coraliomargarita sp. SDUM461003]MDQ8206537.1 hypothetical protein [Coraliomargarita sp. SDUM461003]